MRPVWIEKTKPEDLEEAFKWIAANAAKNNIDWKVLEYPATTLLTAKDGAKNLLHLPIQSVYLLESLGISPDASPLDVVRALSGVMQIVRFISQNEGKGELMFIGSCDETNQFAERHGFERLALPVFRLKIT